MSRPAPVVPSPRRPTLAARAVLLLAFAPAPLTAFDSPFDRLAEALSVSAFDHRWRARVSGLVDLEHYVLPTPPPGVLHAEGRHLFSPRLTLYLDAQLGAQLYAFAQARWDRGFDPQPAGGRLRLDEYALRYTPWRDGRLNLQIGKFGTVIGNWAVRHAAWSNPFVTAPLAYEQLTGVWDSEAVATPLTLLRWSHVRPGLRPAVAAIEKSLRIPIIWGPAYANGFAVSGRRGRLGYAAEVKHAPISSRPESWEPSQVDFSHPTVSARVRYQPGPAWQLGTSASTGTYLLPVATPTLALGHGRGDYRQATVAADAAFAWRHWQVWTEVFASRFAIPTVGDAGVVSFYTEARYRFTPRFAAALRWNQQLFGDIPERAAAVRWGQDAWRLDFAPAWRFSPHTQLKLQYSLQRGDAAPRRTAGFAAAQFSLRF